jgi:putative DNA methylase
MYPIKSPKKLIEVALPLDKINEAAAREKSIRHGHPSTLHLWWARRPLAAARAVIFAQMVNDPGYQQGDGFKYGVNKEKATLERERLFTIIEDLVKWENTSNEEVLNRARAEILRSWKETCDLNKNHPLASELFNPEILPGFHDPFAGGGALPLEAQRLGLESHASDLNPVAVTINKAMIEIPHRFSGRSPIGPVSKSEKQSSLHDDWFGVRGLAEDVRRYGIWMQEQAKQRIGSLYPTIKVTQAMAKERDDLKAYVGEELKVIAWLWARTVKSPNPAFSHSDVPLASTFILSGKSGKEAYVQPVISGDSYKFLVKTGTPSDSAKTGTTAGKRGGFYCLLSGSPVDYKYIRTEGTAGRMGTKLMAIVAEGKRGRVYLSPTKEHEEIALTASPAWRPEVKLDGKCRVNVSNYGMDVYADLFTKRQLVGLTTFSDLVNEVVVRCQKDALEAGMQDDGIGLESGGAGAFAYGQAVSVYLALAVNKMCDRGSSICGWDNTRDSLRNTFGRQAIPMVWDFAEANFIESSAGSFENAVDQGVRVVRESLPANLPGFVTQGDAQNQKISMNKVISSDPPYYDNIEYADLSDFFYVWLRKSLKPIFPQLYATVAVPKAEELVATPFRHGGKEQAEVFFLDGMTQAMHSLAEQAHSAFPVTIYYAFKQSETKGEVGTHSTGWETFLEAVLRAGFALSGTWPMRTELSNRMIGSGANALASSIVLVCRKRSVNAPTVSRREFIRELNARLPEAMADMTRGGVNSPVAPVDLSQAIIGPGMEVFSQYSAVLEADGSHMSVRSALQLINRFFAEDDFDHDTQFCLAWFDHRGWAGGIYGDADVLARAKGTSVQGLAEAGVLLSGGGEVRLLRWPELSPEWSPENDFRTPVWEALHQLIRALNQQGESIAGNLLARMPAKVEPMRALAYRLYTLCERKGWAEEARSYNEIVSAWTGIEQAAQTSGPVGKQGALDI